MQTTIFVSSWYDEKDCEKDYCDDQYEDDDDIYVMMIL